MAISPLYMSMESIYTRQADEARGGTHFTQQRINVCKVWVKISTYEWLYVCTWGPLTTSGEEGAESLVPHLSVSNDPLTWFLLREDCVFSSVKDQTQALFVWISFSLIVESRSHSSSTCSMCSANKCLCVSFVPPCLCRMDDIQLCKEITRLKKELHKLVSIPGRSPLGIDSCWWRIKNSFGK